jgi:hypothetical protein
MSEIWLPELIIASFLSLYFIRPFIKGLWSLDGLVWLPLLSLGITLGLFFAYGFRPECIPLLLFEIVLNIANIPALAFSAASRQNEDFRDWSPFFTVSAIALLGVVFLIMFAFSPKVPPGLIDTGVIVRKIRDEAQKRDYFLRIYGHDQDGGQRPLIFLIPPEAGSIGAVDRICAGLRDRGFRVVSFSRRGFDFPASDEKGRPHFVSPAGIRAMWQAFRQGTVLAKANEQGKDLETERLRDIEFLLPRVSALAGDPAREAPLFLVGYGAGGSALILLSASADFTGRFDHVKGVVAVESRLWSLYRSDPPVFPEAPAGAPWPVRFRMGITRRLAGLKARRVSGPGPLPQSGVPLLALVSDQALSNRVSGGQSAKNPYLPFLEILGRPYAALAAIEGAGPLDYTAYPSSHPLYSFMFPGLNQDSKKSADPLADTAGIITNFVVMLLKGEPVSGSPRIPARQTIDADVYIRTWGLAEF